MYVLKDKIICDFSTATETEESLSFNSFVKSVKKEDECL